jgi:hypothetical protein
VSIEIIEAIGTWIVLPICALSAWIAFMYFASKD